MVHWIDVGDKIVNFDRHLSTLLTEQDVLREIEMGVQDLGKDFDAIYTVHGVQISQLPHFVRVFEEV